MEWKYTDEGDILINNNCRSRIESPIVEIMFIESIYHFVHQFKADKSFPISLLRKSPFFKNILKPNTCHSPYIKVTPQSSDPNKEHILKLLNNHEYTLTTISYKLVIPFSSSAILQYISMVKDNDPDTMLFWDKLVIDHYSLNRHYGTMTPGIDGYSLRLGGLYKYWFNIEKSIPNLCDSPMELNRKIKTYYIQQMNISLASLAAKTVIIATNGDVCEFNVSVRELVIKYTDEDEEILNRDNFKTFGRGVCFELDIPKSLSRIIDDETWFMRSSINPLERYAMAKALITYNRMREVEMYGLKLMVL